MRTNSDSGLEVVAATIVVMISLVIGFAMSFDAPHDCPPSRVPDHARIDRHIFQCPTCDYKYDEGIGIWTYVEGCPELAEIWHEEYHEGEWTFKRGVGWVKPEDHSRRGPKKKPDHM